MFIKKGASARWDPFTNCRTHHPPTHPPNHGPPTPSLPPPPTRPHCPSLPGHHQKGPKKKPPAAAGTAGAPGGAGGGTSASTVGSGARSSFDAAPKAGAATGGRDAKYAARADVDELEVLSTKLAADLRSQIRKLQAPPVLSKQWCDMADTFVRIAKISEMESRLPKDEAKVS